MNIGVFLSGFKPSVGGGFTFQQDIFLAFCRLAGSNNNNFSILCDDYSTYELVRKTDLPVNCNVILLPKNNIRNKIFESLISLFPLLRIKLGKYCRLGKTIKQNAIEFVWYVGGGAYEVLDQPYIATVWDLQHRTHPWMPEVSSNGLWETRELSHDIFLKRAAIVITGTEAGAKEINHFYQIPFNRIHILPHPTPSFALDDDFPIVETQFDQERKGEYFVYPAQFWPHKNHISILIALKKLSELNDKRPKVLFIGSDKGNMKYIQEYADKIGVLDQVIFTGFIEVSELVLLYKDATALIYLSMSGPENLPPLEAFALGCPVIASEFPGSKEQLGDNALLVKAFDTESIAKNMNLVLTDNKLRNDLIEKGKICAAKWSAVDFVNQIFKIVDDFSLVRRNWK